MRRLRSVQLLKKSAPEQPVINHWPLHDHAILGRSINPTAPDADPERVKIFGVLVRQQRFGLSVTALLFEICSNRRAPIMPDKACGAEPDAMSPLDQPPANVHVVAGPPKNR